MDNETRKAVIERLDGLLHEAEQTKHDLWRLIDRHGLYGKNPDSAGVRAASSAASQFTQALCYASTALKIDEKGIAYIKATMTDWYHFHVELDVEEPADPDFVSVTYKGNDEWEVIMETPTGGREKAIVQSDGASWSQVYSVDPA